MRCENFAEYRERAEIRGGNKNLGYDVKDYLLIYLRRAEERGSKERMERRGVNKRLAERMNGAERRRMRTEMRGRGKERGRRVKKQKNCPLTNPFVVHFHLHCKEEQKKVPLKAYTQQCRRAEEVFHQRDLTAGKVTDSAASEEKDFNHLQTLRQLPHGVDRERRNQGRENLSAS